MYFFSTLGEWFYSVKQLILQNRGNLIRERIEGEMPSMLSAISN